MISAIEARKLSDEANDNRWIKEVEEIYKKIKQCSEYGSYSTYVEKKLESKTITKLKEAGYKVEYKNNISGTYWPYECTTISW